MNILVVDCNKATLKALEEKIKKCCPNHVVQGYTDVFMAEKYAETHFVDVLFSEVILDERSGISFAKRLQRLNPKMSVNFVSVTKVYAMDAIQIHADSYLLKPVSDEDVRTQVQLLEAGL